MLRKGELISKKLEEVYPEAPKGFLDHSDPFTLLVAVLLSAQSLDKKVNAVTPELFRQASTPSAMRDLGEKRIRELIREIGLSPQKAANLARLSAKLVDEYDSVVPDTFEALESLPGVGHKTASVVMMQAFGHPAFPVDTHIHRLACRWGCGDVRSVGRTEAALKKWFPDPLSWGELHTRIILFGREHCPARKHDMDACPVCSFAATDESRASNRDNPTKFVGAAKHENPFSIRESVDVAVGHDEDANHNDDDDFEPKKRNLTSSKKSRGVGRKTAKSKTPKGKSGVKAKAVEEEPEVKEEKAEKQLKGKKRGRPMKVIRRPDDENEEDHVSDEEDVKNVPAAKRSRGRKKSSPSGTADVESQKQEAPVRTSSRIRARKAAQ